jgi:hypothetical protein
MSIQVTPIPRLTVLATPAFTLGTANAAGTAATAVASDSTLLAFDTTSPAAVAASAVVGAATPAPRRDHVHDGLVFDGVDPAAVAAAAVVGTATTAPHRDHVHVGTVQAVQTALQLETDQDTYAAPDLIKYSPGVAKAYVATSAVGAMLGGTYNVSSVTVNATGDRTVVFTTDFANVLYIPLTGTQTGNSNFFRQNRNDAGNLRIWIYNAGNTAAVDQATVTAVWGQQATP